MHEQVDGDSGEHCAIDDVLPDTLAVLCYGHNKKAQEKKASKMGITETAFRAGVDKRIRKSRHVMCYCLVKQ